MYTHTCICGHLSKICTVQDSSIPFPDMALTAHPRPCRQLNARWQQPKCKWRPRKKLSRPFQKHGDITREVPAPVFQKGVFWEICRKLGTPPQLV